VRFEQQIDADSALRGDDQWVDFHRRVAAHLCGGEAGPLAFVRAGIARSPETKSLYRQFAVFLAVYYAAAQVAQYLQYLHESPAGTFLDLAWTLPLLGGAYWAATWKATDSKAGASALRAKSTAGMLFRNAMFALGPLIVLFLSSQLGPGWKPVRLIVLGISIVCYAARMALNEHRQTKNAELVKRQMQAMDSSVDGMAIVDGQGMYAYVNSEYARMCGLAGAEEMLGKPWKEVSVRMEKGRAEDATEENIQSRIRGSLLMALSNKFGALVLSTGNKSELGVGYCTLYGDMAGGLAVISDVPKTMVYRLSRYVNSRNPVIPATTLDKPPSAELRPAQKDSDSLPAYDVLDAILEDYVEQSHAVEQIARDHGFEVELVRSVVRMIERNEYKRQQAAPGIKISRKAFGYGRRFPIAAKADI
jgi:NAD+ synthetase